jgi:hypothetical protein
MKVAQYEVLGWRSEKAPRPGWDDRRIQTLVKSHARDQEPNASIVPGGTDISLCNISQHFVLGYFHWSRDQSSSHILRSYVACMRDRGVPGNGQRSMIYFLQSSVFCIL